MDTKKNKVIHLIQNVLKNHRLVIGEKFKDQIDMENQHLTEADQNAFIVDLIDMFQLHNLLEDLNLQDWQEDKTISENEDIFQKQKALWKEIIRERRL